MKPLNVKHINKVLDHIRGDKRRLWMNSLGIKKGTSAARSSEIPQFAECGTACCFAGWSHVLSHKTVKFSLGGYLHGDMWSEGVRMGFTGDEMGSVFYAGIFFHNRNSQWSALKGAIREVVNARIAAGEKSAKGIRL